MYLKLGLIAVSLLVVKSECFCLRLQAKAGWFKRDDKWTNQGERRRHHLLYLTFFYIVSEKLQLYYRIITT